jgi:hypothetical protein
MSERSYLINPARSCFSPAAMQTWQRIAAVLNRARMGDSIVCYLRKPVATEMGSL